MFIIQKYTDGSIAVINTETNRSLIGYLSYENNKSLYRDCNKSKYKVYMNIYISSKVYKQRYKLSNICRAEWDGTGTIYIGKFDSAELDFDPEELEFIISAQYMKYGTSKRTIEHHECVFKLLN